MYEVSISVCIGSTDFESLQPSSFETSKDVSLFIVNDDITLEYNDTVILRYTCGNPCYIPSIEGAGEFIRDTATVYIIDRDSE